MIEGDVKSPSLNLLVRQGQQQLIVQHCVQLSFEYLQQYGDSMTSLGHLCQCSTILTVKKCFLCSEGTWGVYFVPTAFCPFTRHHQEEVGSLIFFPSHIFMHIDKIPPEPSLLQAEQSQLSASPQWGVTRSLMNVLKSNGTSISLLGIPWPASSWTLYHCSQPSGPTCSAVTWYKYF